MGAYDISGARHTILLDKAVQLAEILLGAFDTPNRMPDTVLPVGAFLRFSASSIQHAYSDGRAGITGYGIHTTRTDH